MNFTLDLPLQDMSLIKIAITLWCQDDVRDWLLKSFSGQSDRWEDVEKMVMQKVSRLPLPVLLKERLLDLILPIGLQMHSWIEFHLLDVNCITNLTNMLFWTPHGTIDSKRTAEVLVKDQTIGVEERYIFACIYCLIEDVIDLREEMFRHGIKIHQPFIAMWSSYLQEKLYFKGRRTIETLCYESARNGFDVAFRYIFLKESLQHTQLIIKITQYLLEFENLYHNKKLSDRQTYVLFFLLSKMTLEQQEEIFRTHTYKILQYSLLWPRQYLFLKIANEKWDFISMERYNDLLYDIVHKMSFKRNYISEIFTEFWQQAPQTYKQYVTNQESVGYLLFRLYGKDDEKNIKLILKDSSIFARKKIIFSKYGHHIFIHLVHFARWNTVKYLIQECLSSAEEIIEFKDKFRKYQLPSQCKCPWNEFFQLLEDFNHGYNKRKHMEDKNTSSKRPTL